MSRYILDTDHVSLILCNNSQVVANSRQYQPDLTIITVQELFNGWVVTVGGCALIEVINN